MQQAGFNCTENAPANGELSLIPVQVSIHLLTPVYQEHDTLN